VQDALGGIGRSSKRSSAMAVRALKTVPFMMALSESTTESQANRQFEQHAIAIRSMQHLVETQLERLFTLGAPGPGDRRHRQDALHREPRVREMRDEMVKQLKIANAGEGYALGFIEPG
jgi:hypothetical protein